MRFASPTPYQCSRLRAIAGQPNHGFCVKELVLTNRDQQVDFRLAKERLVQGRAIGPDGRPIAGLRIHLRYFREGASSVSLWPADAAPAAWPKAAVTDDDGRFAIRGIPQQGVAATLTLEVDDERFAPQKTSVQATGDEAVTLRLSSPGVVSGWVGQKDSRVPLGGSWLLVVPTDFQQNADNQQEGFAVRADAEGNFRVRCARASTARSTSIPRQESVPGMGNKVRALAGGKTAARRPY